MKNNYYENPQNGGNGEQPMQNPAQTNGQAYLANPYTMPKNQQERYAPPQHNRGEIFNVQRASQQMNHSDLKKGKCTPTDVDFVYDVKGRGFILGELKYLPFDVMNDIWCGNTQPNSRLQLGQELTLTRLVNGLQSGGMPAVLFLTSHGVANPYEVVNTASTIVLAVYYHGCWHNCRAKLTLKEHTDYFWRAVLRGYGNHLDEFYDSI